MVGLYKFVKKDFNSFYVISLLDDYNIKFLKSTPLDTDKRRSILSLLVLEIVLYFILFTIIIITAKYIVGILILAFKCFINKITEKKCANRHTFLLFYL
jgi:hypothetical protein